MKTVFSTKYNNYLIELKMRGDFLFLYINNIEQDFSLLERKVLLSYTDIDSIQILLKRPRFSKQWNLNVLFNDNIIDEKLFTSTGTIITNETTEKSNIVGYTNPSRFTEIFKRYYGCLPSTYRSTQN